MNYNHLAIFDNEDRLLARVLSGSMPEGTHFHTEDERYIQVATMKWEAGHHMKAHKHNDYGREVYRTNEVMIVKQGKMSATVYDDNGEKVEEVVLGAGDIMVFHGGGHAFDVLQDGTEVIEVKNGPFIGVEKDKTFFE